MSRIREGSLCPALPDHRTDVINLFPPFLSSRETEFTLKTVDRPEPRRVSCEMNTYSFLKKVWWRNATLFSLFFLRHRHSDISFVETCLDFFITVARFCRKILFGGRALNPGPVLQQATEHYRLSYAEPYISKLCCTLLSYAAPLMSYAAHY